MFETFEMMTNLIFISIIRKNELFSGYVGYAIAEKSIAIVRENL